MKKYVLYISTILAAGMMNEAWADTPNCVAESSVASSSRCDSLGYVFNLSACSGKNMVMKCPFDTSKVWCLVSKEKTCAVGDVLYSDDKCYTDINYVPNGVTPKAVVFDATNKLAIELNSVTGKKYLTPDNIQTITPTDTKCGAAMLKITSIWDKMHELIGIRNAYAKGFDPALTLETIYGCKVSGVAAVLDVMSGETEVYEQFSDFSGLKSSSSIGYTETLALYQLAGVTQSTYTLATPAAAYCMNKNTNCHIKQNCNCDAMYAGNSTVSIKPWFMPRIGDLITIGRNREAVQSGLTAVRNKYAYTDYSATTIGANEKLNSSTLGYNLGSTSNVKKYIDVWFALPGRSGFPASDTATVSGYVGANSFQYSDNPLRCIYHYGGYTINNMCFDSNSYNSAPF